MIWLSWNGYQILWKTRSQWTKRYRATTWSFYPDPNRSHPTHLHRQPDSILQVRKQAVRFFSLKPHCPVKPGPSAHVLLPVIGPHVSFMCPQKHRQQSVRILTPVQQIQSRVGLGNACIVQLKRLHNGGPGQRVQKLYVMHVEFDINRVVWYPNTDLLLVQHLYQQSIRIHIERYWNLEGKRKCKERTNIKFLVKIQFSDTIVMII